MGSSNSVPAVRGPLAVSVSKHNVLPRDQKALEELSTSDKLTLLIDALELKNPGDDPSFDVNKIQQAIMILKRVECRIIIIADDGPEEATQRARAQAPPTNWIDFCRSINLHISPDQILDFTRGSPEHYQKIANDFQDYVIRNTTPQNRQNLIRAIKSKGNFVAAIDREQITLKEANLGVVTSPWSEYIKIADLVILDEQLLSFSNAIMFVKGEGSRQVKAAKKIQEQARAHLKKKPHVS